MANECKVCLIDHDPETHEATLRVRQWFRQELARRLEPAEYSPEPLPPAMPEPESFDALNTLL